MTHIVDSILPDNEYHVDTRHAYKLHQKILHIKVPESIIAYKNISLNFLFLFFIFIYLLFTKTWTKINKTTLFI